MRSNCRVFLAIVLLALGTWAFAQNVNPTPPPSAPPSETTLPPLPETQSTVPTMIPTESTPTPTAGTPVPTLTPTKILGVDTSVVLGRVPAPRTPRPEKKASANTAAKKRGDKEASKALEAATVAALGDAAVPPPLPSPNASASTASSQATDNPAPAPAAGAVRSDSSAGNAQAQPRRMKGGGLWILLAIFVLSVIGMVTYIARRRSTGAKKLSILPDGASSKPRPPLGSGRRL